MINIAFRLILTFNSTFLLIVVYCAQYGYTLGSASKYIPWLSWTKPLPNYYSYILYILLPIGLTGLSILISRLLGKDEFKAGNVQSIELANNAFLPSYLGYFFVALSVSGLEAFVVVYFLLFIFTFLSQALYFNPLFLLFGYQFYNVTTKNGTVVFLISRHKYKNPSEVNIPKAYRINNYTFIERG